MACPIPQGGHNQHMLSINMLIIQTDIYQTLKELPTCDKTDSLSPDCFRNDAA